MRSCSWDAASASTVKRTLRADMVAMVKSKECLLAACLLWLPVGRRDNDYGVFGDVTMNSRDPVACDERTSQRKKIFCSLREGAIVNAKLLDK